MKIQLLEIGPETEQLSACTLVIIGCTYAK